MKLLSPVQVDQVAASWRLGLDTAEDNPAGPLFLAGRYAVGEITASDPALNTQSQCQTAWLTNCPPMCHPIEDVGTAQ
ncbi:hypothetical protein Rhe02_96620 [Rhizocola hellebori]|uniref:Uncharacterized protein n=1 Tax=Rhizocola hellebori TaxID=1392758 RepID=A0A8J3QIQ2_9ACTN|nr:DUF6229 family protein [Rhizocola hellebori]GIH11595.1 hypothetical protein Rhe02_96620 [Rhizocola hellebori]